MLIASVSHDLDPIELMIDSTSLAIKGGNPLSLGILSQFCLIRQMNVIK